MRYFISILLLCIFPGLMANQNTQQLQEVLNRGEDLVLKVKGQHIYTNNVKSIRDYATLRVVRPELVTIINADALRRALMVSPEFVNQNQAWRTSQLQEDLFSRYEQ